MNFLTLCPRTETKPLIACDQETMNPIGMYCLDCRVFEKTDQITAAFNSMGKSHFTFEVEI